MKIFDTCRSETSAKAGRIHGYVFTAYKHGLTAFAALIGNPWTPTPSSST
ncbi:hypothetical protein [Actinophytocola sediminis]